ncbi:hypothetical protein [Nannocystis sp.]|uniref:hypothetical protein n=1 Tax=Nannocystis sp. TaxID=1962667 RepID=UPI0025FAA1CB|nr:hypothetical protein [Nannocystis sp.]MBK7828669.1 hypothetical protein [Nannocystis sp.]
MSVPVALALTLMIAACGDSGRQDSDATGGQSTGVSATGGATEPVPTSSSGGDPTGMTGSGTAPTSEATTAVSATGSTGATTGAGFCPILCGPANTCCQDGEACIAETCVEDCASGVLCAAVCCEVGAVCVADECKQPAGDCEESLDCESGEFCEPTLEKCLPQFPAEGLCEFAEIGEFNPALKWSWTQTAVQPAYNQAVSAPLIVDLDDDGVPEVIFTTKAAPHQNITGYMRVLDGKTGAEKWDGSTDALSGANPVNTTFSPAVADLEGDGPAEIVALATTGEIIAFTADGAVKWRSRKPDDTAYAGFAGKYSSAISLADMDGDGKGEVVLGGVVLDHTGKVISGIGRELLSQVAGYGMSSVIADIDGDGTQDVVGGNAAYRRDGAEIWTQPIPDGFPGIADFDGDGAPELVVTTAAGIRLQDAATGAQIAFLGFGGDGLNGPPTVAEVDGDPALEIGIQRNVPCDYTIFDYDPATKVFTAKWTTPLSVCSGLIAATAFDFDGDKQVELVVHDDCDVFILSGVDGGVLLKLLASHGTWSEFTSIADVDGDKSADIAFSANNDYHMVNPGYCGNTGNNGVHVYSDPEGKWMPTRRVWNQQSYHITNIKADGSLPKPEPDSWGPDGFNNYRVSFQGKGVFNAADLIVDLEISGIGCPAQLVLRARVKNIGSLGVPAGVKVLFFAGVDATGTLLGEQVTTLALLPGAFEVVEQPYDLDGLDPVAIYVTVDGFDAQSGVIPECNEDNNSAANASAQCVIPG